MAHEELARMQQQGQVATRVVPGEGTVVILRGVLDAALAPELERQLQAAHRANPPVTVDMTAVRSLDGTVVDVLAEASASFPEGLRVTGATGMGAHLFESTQVEHLRV